ncbi:TauD/TfdA family dioxygenase [Actinacidiphila sp. ITFR-21]|uniref:TauD/TfdA family dioxygenase n=1 Tax=Actinacidiphila sp. ITFR-21 TaxID=3075199 RepID=UPI002889C8B8|nr:TauD/TfdA family dioxygenase [Streptomyces sp. ITFR-21]WNI18056.1 TauD/TfdA family dioxygenase [Streptomyces sp. ITFR-21]
MSRPRSARTTPVGLFAGHYVDVHAAGAGELVAARLRETGLATFTGLDSRAAVLALASRFLNVAQHRDSGPDGLTVIRDTGRHTGRAGFAGLGHGPLLPHTEGTALPEPPRLMLMVCARPAEQGGICLLTDGRHPTSLAR